MNREEMNKALGMSEEELDRAALEYETDTWDASALGKPAPGRPAVFDAPMGTISFKEEVPKIEHIDARAAELGMTRSDYMRRLVDRDLAASKA